ncbi:MAG: sulfatase [Deltaproteobacteria bacterium]|nr:sulfatase [Deltaproteobacteria bacterium]
MSSSRSLRATVVALTAAVALAGTSCGDRPASRARSDSPLAPLAVARRLTAQDFGLVPVAPPHRPVVKIGDEARTVALGPLVLDVATVRGVALDGGRARRDIEVPEAARALPDDAFRVEAQLVPITGEVAPEVFDFLATETFHAPVETRWTLSRDASGAGDAVLEVAPIATSEGRLNLDVRALLPQPASVTSAAFDVPSGASLGLGYGLTAGSAGPARLRAALLCEGVETRLVDETLTPGELAWHDATRDLPPGRGCRLRLETTTPEGGAVRSAAWAEPMLFAPQPPRAHPIAENVILISLDTLRADHVSGYGYPRPTSPSIDARLIAGGTTFTDVSTTFPRTDVAHLSLFTSLYPAAQPEAGRLRADTTALLLTESLRDAGLVTAGFTEDAMIAGAFGFWFGFDRFVERAYAERERGHRTFEDGITFLRTNADHRFFLFLHTYKTHKPYVAAERYAGFAPASDWQTLPLDPRVTPAERPPMDAYDRTIREADDLVASLLAELDRLGVAGRTLVVLLSDHGEAFGEHGAVDHGYAGHQEQLRIPLVLRGPGIPAGLRVDAPSSIVDVAPTVVALAGAAPLAAAQGTSLAAAFTGHDLPRHRPLFFSWLAKGAQGVRHGAWKYLRADHGHELFDLASDPGEDRPRLRRRPARAADAALLASHRDASARLRALLDDRTGGGNGPTPPAGATAPVDARTHESLRALGYVGD